MHICIDEVRGFFAVVGFCFLMSPWLKMGWTKVKAFIDAGGD